MTNIKAKNKVGLPFLRSFFHKTFVIIPNVAKPALALVSYQGLDVLNMYLDSFVRG